MTDQPASTTSSYVDNYQPPASSTPSASRDDTSAVSPSSPPIEPTSSAKNSGETSNQTLEAQNIFTLLGVTSATDAEKEDFLNQLQQVIWEDFLENDVQLLITDQELVELRRIMSSNQGDELAQQEAVMAYLQKLIPDLEEIMMEKALELKADMVKERIAGMREYYADKPTQLAEIEKAEAQLRDDQWQSVAKTLNAVQ